MSKLMSNDLVKNHYTWAGRCENKKSFSDLSLKRLVIGTHVLTATDHCRNCCPHYGLYIGLTEMFCLYPVS